jgi:type IV pilus assembly protein PilQ
MISKKRNPWQSLIAIALLGTLLFVSGCTAIKDAQPLCWNGKKYARCGNYLEAKWRGLSGDSKLELSDMATVERMAHIKTQQGDKISLFSNKPLIHQIFRLSSPTRVVLVFPKTTLGPTIQPTIITDGNLTGLFPSETKAGSSRIEVTLGKLLEYEIVEREDGLDIIFIAEKSQVTGQKAGVSDVAVSHQKNRTALRLLGQGVVATPKAFRLNNPPRLVVDMVGVTGPAQSRRLPIDSPHALHALLVGGPQKTRLVVELVDPSIGFLLEQDAGMPVIQLGHDLQSSGETPTAAGLGKSGVYDVQFTREGQGALVRILLNRKGGALKTSREDRQIFLSMTNTPVVPALIRRMDVRAFGGPVLNIDTAFKEGGAYMVVTLDKVGSRHEVLEKAGEILVRIHPAPQKAGEEVSPYTGSKISLDFKEIDVQNALRVVAEVSNLNIILSDSVSGTLTMRLVDVPWDQALELILEAKGLGRVKQGNVLRIAPLAEIQATADARLKAQQSARQLEPFVTEMIPVSFADGDDLRKLLLEGDPQHKTRLISVAGTVSIDTRTNTLIVKDTAENIAKVREMVQKLDKPIPQVLIEARIVEVDRESRDEFGIKWGFSTKSRDGGFAISDNATNAYTAHNATPGTTNPRARMTDIDDTPVIPTNVNLPTATAATGMLGVHLGGLSPLIDLDLEITALETDNKARTISSPRVLTTNNQKASIGQGVKVPYTVTEDGVPVTTFIEATLSLEVTPQVTPNNYITLKIVATNDSITGSGTTMTVNTKTIDTQALVNDGETIVLGGIFQNIKNRDKSMVPGLSNIPFFGKLFKNHADYDKQSELLIFITPHIIHPRQ